MACRPKRFNVPVRRDGTVAFRGHDRLEHGLSDLQLNAVPQTCLIFLYENSTNKLNYIGVFQKTDT